MSASILFYGYNLGELDGFDHPFEEEGWFKDAYGQDGGLVGVEETEGAYLLEIREALLVASGVDMYDRSYCRGSPLEAVRLVAALRGVEVFRYSHSEMRLYGLALAGTVQRSDGWRPMQVSPKVPEVIDWQLGGASATKPPRDVLREALMILGKKEPGEPSWILGLEE